LKLFYFVGGPPPDQQRAFLARLAELGGPPPGWRIYPHASGNGQALHLVETDDVASIPAHLTAFGPAYGHEPIVEVIDPGRPPA
jgi:hypothetical protein